MGGQDGWTAVDALIGSTLLADDPALQACLTNSAEHGLPDIAVSAPQGRFLALIAKISGARRVLEVGTLGGYSTIHLARGVGAGGDITTLELDPAFAEVARANIAGAGLESRVDVVTGPALDTLTTLDGPYDLAFIDADKVNNSHYVDHAIRLGRTGMLIIVDNVVRDGAVLDPHDQSARASRQLYDYVARHPRLQGTALQTVGDKGWDGMMLLEVTD